MRQGDQELEPFSWLRKSTPVSHMRLAHHTRLRNVFCTARCTLQPESWAGLEGTFPIRRALPRRRLRAFDLNDAHFPSFFFSPFHFRETWACCPIRFFFR